MPKAEGFSNFAAGRPRSAHGPSVAVIFSQNYF